MFDTAEPTVNPSPHERGASKVSFNLEQSQDLSTADGDNHYEQSPPHHEHAMTSPPPAQTIKVTLTNYSTGQQWMVDVPASDCRNHCCTGALVKFTNGIAPKGSMASQRHSLRDRKRILISEAEEYLALYHKERETTEEEYLARLSQVRTEIETTGTYTQTKDEISYGAKVAWRNAPRCINRVQWNNLELIDARHVTTAEEIFNSLCEYLKFAYNGGAIINCIAVFPPEPRGIRIWNSALLRYAGYRNPDGNGITGDPANVELTDMCIKLGWKGKGTRFDVLPIIIQESANAKPKLFELPKELHFEVPLSHPTYKCFEELDLRWFSIPTIANMVLEIGGIRYTACPFNGYFMCTEIGARNLGDVQRYNMLPAVAEKLGLDTSTNASLWRDKALIELNVAVLHSFKKHKVTITDHHTASEGFMLFHQREMKARGNVPGDWVWLTPPISGSACPVFHLEMLNYVLKPMFDYMPNAWELYDWPHEDGATAAAAAATTTTTDDASQTATTTTTTGQPSEVPAAALRLSTSSNDDSVGANRHGGKRDRDLVPVTILFGTETGKSEALAYQLQSMFNDLSFAKFDTKVICLGDIEDFDKTFMCDKGVDTLYMPKIPPFIVVITSTFGTGGPPSNGEKFEKWLKDKQAKTQQTRLIGGRITYGVFALGNSLYDDFCGFGRFVDTSLHVLGAKRMLEMGEGDDLSGYASEFSAWKEKLRSSIRAIIEEARGEHGSTDASADHSPSAPETMKLDFRKKPARRRSTINSHNPRLPIGRKNPFYATVLSVESLEKTAGAARDDHSTILLRLDLSSADENVRKQLVYEPGDHVGVYPCNEEEAVLSLLSRVSINGVYHDDMDKLREVMDTPFTCSGRCNGSAQRIAELAAAHGGITLREVLLRHVDITTPLSQEALRRLAARNNDPKQCKRLIKLSTNAKKYSKWISTTWPSVSDILDEFPGTYMPIEELLELLPPMQPRFYSISSSQAVHKNEVHLTVSVVTFRTLNNVNKHEKNKRIRRGVCSNFLAKSKANVSKVPIFFRKNESFRLPKEPCPIIMVSAGSGIAPFRSFWQQLDHERSAATVASATTDSNKSNDNGNSNSSSNNNNNNRNSGDSPRTVQQLHFFFGCRGAKYFLFEDELVEECDKGIITQIYTAFSRDDPSKKVYVQDRLRETRSTLWDLLHTKGARFYVCGDLRVAHGVDMALYDMARNEGRLSKKEAIAWLESLKRDQRYLKEVFGHTAQVSISVPTGISNGQLMGAASHVSSSYSSSTMSIMREKRENCIIS